MKTLPRLRWTFAFCLLLWFCPAIVSASPGVKLMWDAVSDPTVQGYKLHYGSVSGTHLQTFEAGSSTSAFVDDLLPGTTYYFVVTAYNADALESEPSLEVSVVIGRLNQPPTILLVSPVAGLDFKAPATIPLRVTASDFDGTVSRIEYYSGASLLGDVTSAPFDFSWSPVSQGSYVISARAYDDAGGFADSQPIIVNVSADSRTFVGMFVGGAAAEEGSVAIAKISISKTGRFTGRLTRGSMIAPVSGQFDASGSATIMVRPVHGVPYTLILTLNAADHTVALSIPNSEPPLHVTLGASIYKKGQVVAGAGRYTMVIGRLIDNGILQAEAPGGYGSGTVVVSPTGKFRIVGVQGDLRPFMMGGTLREEGRAFVAARPYPGSKGSLAGEFDLAPTATADGTGELVWMKPAQVGTGFYRPKSWLGSVSLGLSRYDRLTPVATINQSFHVAVAEADSVLPSLEFAAAFAAQRNTRSVSAKSGALAVQIGLANGIILGTLETSATEPARRLHGVVFQKTGEGFGLVAGGIGTGNFAISNFP